mgnify:CR=1 FL=1
MLTSHAWLVNRAQKKWEQKAETKQLMNRLAFYEQQLKEADDTLIATKQAMTASAQTLMDEVKNLEASLNKTKARKPSCAFFSLLNRAPASAVAA